MKLVLLGSSALAEPGRDYVSLLVEKDGSLLLFDCGGSPIRKILEAGFDPLKLHALFVTHSHTDHVYAFPVIIHELFLRERREPLLVFGPEEALTKLQSLLKLFFEGNEDLFPVEFIPAVQGKEIGIAKDLKVMPTRVEHGVPTFAYKVKKRGRAFVYAPDLGPESNLDFVRGSDILFIDSTFLDDEERAKRKGHMTLFGSLKLAQAAGVKKLVLIHFGLDKGLRNYLKSEWNFKNLPFEVFLGRDFLSFEL